MLTVFLKNTSDNVHDSGRILEAFKGLCYKVVLISHVEDINTFDIKTPWYGIFYDNEIIDSNLYLALLKTLPVVKAEVLVIYRYSFQHNHLCNITFSPRIFRKQVKLRGDGSFFPAKPGWTIGTMMQGVIIGYD